MPHSPALRAPLRALALTLAVALPAPLLGGCDAIYDDTKGWANRLEAKVLETAHEMDEPDPEAPAESMAMAAPEPAPPAVPVAAVETAQLTPQPPLPEPLPEALPKLLPMTPDPGMMAQAAEKNVEKPVSGKDTNALPPHPQPKPEVPAVAKATPAKATERPASTAADAAVAVVLHLSSLRSEEAAKREWSDLQHNFPRPLGDMAAEFHRTELGEKGTFYRVLAGPLPSRDKAREVCAELKAKNAKQYCRILPAKPKAS